MAFLLWEGRFRSHGTVFPRAGDASLIERSICRSIPREKEILSWKIFRRILDLFLDLLSLRIIVANGAVWLR
jgi:hypothetical protein